MSTLVRTPEGEIAITPAALQQLIAHAAEAVDGVRLRRPRRGLDVRIADGRCRVSLEVTAPYGAQLAELGEVVQEHVAEALRRMLELDVDAVDVSVEEFEG